MKTVRVLIADDHEVVRRGLKDVLDQATGIEVVGEAADGREAFRMACRLTPDVVVLDISMPDGDGVTTAERIREKCPEVSVIALTMHDDRANLARMLEAGAAGYVLKRAGADELLRAIRTVTEGRTYVDPVLAGLVLRRRSGEVEVSGDPRVLSDREEQVLREVAWGHGNTAIGRKLGISPRTVETYRGRIREKLGLEDRSDFVRYALRHGWLSVD